MNDALDHGEHMRDEAVTMSRAEYEAELRKARAEGWEWGHDEPKECCGYCPINKCPWDNGGNGPINPYRTNDDETGDGE